MSPDEYQTLKMIWNNVAITIKHNSSWSKAYADIQSAKMTHTIIIRDDGLALPISDSGFRSLWLDSRNLEQYEGILDYVKQWLDHDAQSKKWKAIQDDQNQLKLF